MGHKRIFGAIIALIIVMGTISPLLAAALSSMILAIPNQVKSGEQIIVTMQVTNTNGTVANNVSPSSLTINKKGTAYVVLVSGPIPSSANISPNETQDFLWKYKAYSGGAGGTVTFQGNATGIDAGTGLSIRSTMTLSNVVRIQPRMISSENINLQMCPLANYTIQDLNRTLALCNDLVEEAEESALCDQQRQELIRIKKKLQEAEDLINKAIEFRETFNCIPAIFWTQKIDNLLRECLSALRLTGVRSEIRFAGLSVTDSPLRNDRTSRPQGDNHCAVQQNLFVECTYEENNQIKKCYIWVQNVFQIWRIPSQTWVGKQKWNIWYVQCNGNIRKLKHKGEFFSEGKVCVDLGKQNAPTLDGGIILETYLRKIEGEICIMMNGPEAKNECVYKCSDCCPKTCIKARIISNANDQGLKEYFKDVTYNNKMGSEFQDSATRPEIELTGWGNGSTASFHVGTHGTVRLQITTKALEEDPRWEAPTTLEVIDGINIRPQAGEKSEYLEWNKKSFEYNKKKKEYGISFS